MEKRQNFFTDTQVWTVRYMLIRQMLPRRSLFDDTFRNTENTYIAQTDIVPVCADS